MDTNANKHKYKRIQTHINSNLLNTYLYNHRRIITYEKVRQHEQLCDTNYRLHYPVLYCYPAKKYQDQYCALP